MLSSTVGLCPHIAGPALLLALTLASVHSQGRALLLATIHPTAGSGKFSEAHIHCVHKWLVESRNIALSDLARLELEHNL